MQNKFLNKLHRLFDPTAIGGAARAYSMKYPPDGKNQPTQVPQPPPPPAPGNTSIERLKIQVGNAVQQVDQTLEILETDLTGDVELTVGRLKDGLHHEHNSDLVVHRFDLPLPVPVKGYLVFFSGVVDSTEIERAVLLPMLELSRAQAPRTGLELLDLVDRQLIPSRQTSRTFDIGKAITGVAEGKCALLLDTVPAVVLIDERAYPTRGIEQPNTEQVVRGPQEGFNENVLHGTALLRRRLKTPDLVFEQVEIGRRSRTVVMMAYIKGLANSDLLEEVRRRLSALDVDMLAGSGTLEQLLEDSPLGFFPTMQDTQRTDRASASLSEGRVVLMVDGSPFVLIMPAVFGDFFRNPEDYYIKWPFGTLLRIIRLGGMLTTMLLPAMYIAIANHHQEMIPSSLLLAIAASRESVPFPAPYEVMLMEGAFEIIREGSLRIPSVLGQTVGIVGALILGQAAVQANIVSPILVIIVATTALGSFTIPNYGMSLPIRFARFLFILLAASFGLYGVAVGLFAISAHAASLRSFGVPYMSPSGPRKPGSPDAVYRGPVYSMDRRPEMVQPQDEQRQKPGAMRWNPMVPKQTKPSKGGGNAVGPHADR